MKNKDKVLEYLKTIEKANSGDIANKLGIDPKNIGRYLKTLENEGLITKEKTFKGNIRYNTWKIIDKKTSRKKEEVKPEKEKRNTPSKKHFSQDEKERIKDILIRAIRNRTAHTKEDELIKKFIKEF